MNFFDPSVKFTHFVYNVKLSNEEIIKKDCTLELGKKISIDTNTVSGFYLRWIVTMSTPGGVMLDVIADDSYNVHDASEIKAEDMLLLMEKSLLNFKIILSKRLGKKLAFDIPMDEALAATFLIELCQ